MTDSLKEELANLAEPAEDEAKDKVIRDTIRQLISFLQWDELPTTKNGDQKDQSEPNIYKNDLQTLHKQAQEKFKYISQLSDRATKAIDDEKQARIDLNTIELETEQINGPLINKIAELKGHMLP